MHQAMTGISSNCLWLPKHSLNNNFMKVIQDVENKCSSVLKKTLLLHATNGDTLRGK